MPWRQARGAFGELERVLEASGGGLADVVDIMSFHSDIRDADAVMEVGPASDSGRTSRHGRRSA